MEKNNDYEKRLGIRLREAYMKDYKGPAMSREDFHRLIETAEKKKKRKKAMIGLAAACVALCLVCGDFVAGISMRESASAGKDDETKTVQQGGSVIIGSGVSEDDQNVGVIYNYVINHITYDRAKAAKVTSGYLPDLDQVLESKKGICFDYAALMTGMLRSQGVPCKLVIGYAGTAYHAWISVWVEGVGWVENVVYFDGTTWQRMDPTFASTGGQSEKIMAYIGDGQNYSAKYLY